MALVMEWSESTTGNALRMAVYVAAPTNQSSDRMRRRERSAGWQAVGLLHRKLRNFSKVYQ